ncbi:hypothetical protein [Flavobacterium filum]|uniref:hypothetical protein n=1 Tax=Flavobacterium filum TaxID=370974 RepID=UPI0023F4D208|nr:hypothetical protein [Flavobacterium filum]
MNNIHNIVEQHPSSVAQLFSKYGINKAVNAKNLSSAVVVYKQPFIDELEQLILLDDNYVVSEEYADDYVLMEDYSGRRFKARKRFEKALRRRGLLNAQRERYDVDELRTIKKGTVRPQYIEESIAELPEYMPVQDGEEYSEYAEYDILSGADGEEVKVKKVRKRKKGGAYEAGSVLNYDVKANRRSSKDIIDTAGNVIKAGADAAGAIAGAVGAGKAAKGGGSYSVADSADSGAKPSFFTKYKAYIIGLIAVIVIGGAAVLMLKKKK